MTCRASRHLVVAALWFGALAGVGILARSPSQQGSDPPTTRRPPVFRGGANFVTVDVYPRRGRQFVDGLTAADFDVKEDGRAQTIDSVELIRFAPFPPDGERRDPNTLAESWHLVADPRQRVFVLYLDAYHATVTASHNARPRLIEFLSRTMGPSDLIAMMTPEVPATAMTFGRRLDSIEAFLTKYWIWGGAEYVRSAAEQEIDACALTLARNPASARSYAEAMIARWRLDRVMSSLRGIVEQLGAARDQRKHVVLITEGWTLSGPADDLAPAAAGPTRPIGSMPTGRPLPGTQGAPASTQAVACGRELSRLAQLDFREQFDDLIDLAQRGNVSVHPVNPVGQVTFPSSLKEGAAVDPRSGLPSAKLRSAEAMAPTRILERLAETTQGTLVADTNDVAGGLRRLADAVSAYYLLGYYSTNRKFDGKYRKIEVRARTPGIEVDARRGYLAPTAAMAKAAMTPAGGGSIASTRTFVGDAVLQRGTAGGVYAPTSEPQFRRFERLRLEWPLLVASPLDRRTARLLGRDGRPLPVPLTVTDLTRDGAARLACDVALAPLAEGDYAVELVVGQGREEQRPVTPFQVIR